MIVMEKKKLVVIMGMIYMSKGLEEPQKKQSQTVKLLLNKRNRNLEHGKPFAL